jgi:hypothetical protein
MTESNSKGNVPAAASSCVSDATGTFQRLSPRTRYPGGPAGPAGPPGRQH